MSTTRVLVVGAGAVGSRAARQLASVEGVEVLVHDVDPHRVDLVVSSLGPPARAATADEPADVVILATPSDLQSDLARRSLERGVPVVATADGVDAVEALLGLSGVAVAGGAALVVGAGFA
nr:Gfo/Idh/MocA family oxidoreductase [Acidimicrobiia bacterium]